MATDVEARDTGSSALVIGILALVLIVGAVWFFAMRPSGEVVPVPVSGPNTTVVQPPAPAAPPTTVVQPAAPPTTVVVPPASGGGSSGGDAGKGSTGTGSPKSDG